MIPRWLGWCLCASALGLLACVVSPRVALGQATRPPARAGSYVVREVATAPAAARAAGARLEIAVTGDGVFPARAGDPVLHVGDVTLRGYRYADSSNRTLVFTVPPGTALADGAPVYLQYEPGGDLRIDLPPFRAADVQRVTP